MSKQVVTYFKSPLGLLMLEAEGDVITKLLFVDDAPAIVGTPPNHQVLKEASLQLREYFAGERKQFDFPIQQQGTAFQQRVWHKLQDIGYGHTTSYLQLARSLGDEKCIRAAASANGKNNLAIVVPCHRVIGSDGSLTGYAGGLWRKQWLLQHEGILKPEPQQATLSF